MGMDLFVNYETKIKIYAQIQKNLLSLECNSDDFSLIEIINQIPPNFLKYKESLKVICSLFANYSQISFRFTRNAIKLFEFIMPSLKLYMKDESSYFWHIFNGIFYFKLCMFKEGLISIEELILQTQKDDTMKTAEYFLPEIYHNIRYFYEKEIKMKLQNNITQSYIYNFESIREKHIKWLHQSNEFDDPLFLEIETDKLRLSIKKDDVYAFQSIISNTNIEINSKLNESVFDMTKKLDPELTLIEYAVYYDAMNIFKFLIMNGACIDNDDVILNSISNRNHEMFHIIESSFGNFNKKKLLYKTIDTWNCEVAEYIENNYKIITNSDYFFSILIHTFMSSNFIFFQSKILPFFKKNNIFIVININRLVSFSFYDLSCFFLNIFLKYPQINIKFYDDKNRYEPIIYNAFRCNNLNAVKFLLNHQNINPNVDFNGISLIQLAIGRFYDLEIVKMICNHKKICKNNLLRKGKVNIFDFALSSGNFLAAIYLLDHFKSDLKIPNENIMFDCLINQHFCSIEILLPFYICHKKCDCQKLLNDFKLLYSDDFRFNDLLINKFMEIYKNIEKHMNKNAKERSVGNSSKWMFYSIIICLFYILLYSLINNK